MTIFMYCNRWKGKLKLLPLKQKLKQKLNRWPRKQMLGKSIERLLLLTWFWQPCQRYVTCNISILWCQIVVWTRGRLLIVLTDHPVESDINMTLIDISTTWAEVILRAKALGFFDGLPKFSKCELEHQTSQSILTVLFYLLIAVKEAVFLDEIHLMIVVS